MLILGTVWQTDLICHRRVLWVQIRSSLQAPEEPKIINISYIIQMTDLWLTNLADQSFKTSSKQQRKIIPQELRHSLLL